MKTILSITAAAAMLLSTATSTVAGTYPIGLNQEYDCVVWLVVPFPCHEGFEYEEPGGNNAALGSTEEPVVDDEQPKGKPGKGWGKGGKGWGKGGKFGKGGFRR